LFSIDNQYDQPPNNLVRWWKEKPDFHKILEAIGGKMENTHDILCAAEIFQEREAYCKHRDTTYWILLVEEGERDSMTCFDSMSITPRIPQAATKSKKKRPADRAPAKNEPDALFVSVCSFKRTAKSPLEFGVMINEDHLIIDMKGKAVEGELHSYKCLPHEGAFIVRNKF
jgi:hypothetical protein